MISRRKPAQKQVSWRSLARKSDFQKVYERGAKRVGRLVVVYFLVPDGRQAAAEGLDFAWAVVASKKVGNAVARNRAKRLLREARRLGFLGQLGALVYSDEIRRSCERLRWEPGENGALGGHAGDKPAVERAGTAETNTFAGLWVVLVARRRILSASSREVREELDSLLAEDSGYIE